MLGKINRKIKYFFYCTTLDDLQDDIENKQIDFNKYLVTIPAGTKMYRFARKDDDPIAPTGIGEGYPGCRYGHRWISSPLGFSAEEYRKKHYSNDPDAVASGSGGTTYSFSPAIARKEVMNADSCDFYEITLKKDIQVVDLELICKGLRIPTPLSSERHPVYHKFYGTHIRGIKFRSFRLAGASPTRIEKANIFIYNDWFKEFKDIVDEKKIE